jgi:hypothetical protein
MVSRSANRRKAMIVTIDPELLYTGAMFHDMGLTPASAGRAGRDAARDAMRQEY